MRKAILLSACIAALALTGCGLAGNVNDWIWPVPRPCTLTTWGTGAGEEVPPFVAERILESSVATKALREWADGANLTPEQVTSLTAALTADRQTDRWVLKHLQDIWKQMWWRGENDKAWKEAGYNNR